MALSTSMPSPWQLLGALLVAHEVEADPLASPIGGARAAP